MTDKPIRDPLGELSAAGVSVWLDDLSRELLAGGQLARLIAEHHVVGVTTNPTIFASALAKGDRYTEQLGLLADAGRSVDDAAFAITTADVRAACQELRQVYDAGADASSSSPATQMTAMCFPRVTLAEAWTRCPCDEGVRW